MKEKRKTSTKKMLALCYAGWFILMLLCHFAGFLYNQYAYAAGVFQPRELTLEDFEWQDIIEKNGIIVTIGSDPQLILKETGVKIDTFVAEVEYTLPPRQELVFFSSGQGEGYSARKMEYPEQRGDEKWFYLPVFGVENFRFDPGTVAGNVLTIKRLAVNQPRPFTRFFYFSAAELILFVVLPGMLAAVLSCFQQGIEKYQKGNAGVIRKKDKP